MSRLAAPCRHCVHLCATHRRCASHLFSGSFSHALSAPSSFHADSFTAIYSLFCLVPTLWPPSTHPLSPILPSPLVFMQTPPLCTLSHTTTRFPQHTDTLPSPEHMQSRGISFYCVNSLCNHTHLSFVHCSNTFGVEVALLRAATQSVQESQLLIHTAAIRRPLLPAQRKKHAQAQEV